jgi:hypothetical protein
MKKIILTLMIFAITFVAKSQDMNLGSEYKTAIGLKVFPGSVSIKHFISDNVAVEGLGYFWQYGFRATALYEMHGNFTGVDGLKWYVGPGAHVGFYNTQWAKDYPTRNSGVAIGIDGVIGIDYKIQGAPLNVSFDWQPSVNLVGYSYFEGGWGGLGIRYTF